MHVCVASIPWLLWKMLPWTWLSKHPFKSSLPPLWGTCIEMDLLDHMAIPCTISKEQTYFPLEPLHNFMFPSAMHKNSSLSISLFTPAVLFCCFVSLCFVLVVFCLFVCMWANSHPRAWCDMPSQSWSQFPPRLVMCNIFSCASGLPAYPAWRNIHSSTSYFNWISCIFIIEV